MAKAGNRPWGLPQSNSFDKAFLPPKPSPLGEGRSQKNRLHLAYYLINSYVGYLETLKAKLKQ